MCRSYVYRTTVASTYVVPNYYCNINVYIVTTFISRILKWTTFIFFQMCRSNNRQRRRQVVPPTDREPSDDRTSLQVLPTAQSPRHHGFKDPQPWIEDAVGAVGAQGAQSEQEQVRGKKSTLELEMKDSSIV